ncbi:hypothetical protein BAZ12_15770 [Elizabethkingia miricola]|nr:hypothetical protein BAZ12_15770 [Elizabethkingia miricola]
MIKSIGVKKTVLALPLAKCPGERNFASLSPKPPHSAKKKIKNHAGNHIPQILIIYIKPLIYSIFKSNKVILYLLYIFIITIFTTS